PALAEGDTGRLPDVPSQQAPEAPAAPVASAPVVLSRVQLVDGAGAELSSLSPEQPAEVRIDYTALEGTEGAVLELSIESANGKALYVTSTRTDAVALPARLPGEGRVRFLIE